MFGISIINNSVPFYSKYVVGVFLSVLYFNTDEKLMKTEILNI